MNRSFAILTLIGVAAASANAQLTFGAGTVSNVVLDTQAALGDNGQTFGFTSASSKVQGANKSKTYTLGFSASSAGGAITGFTISPLGSAFRGATSVMLDFGGGQIFNYTASSPITATQNVSLGTQTGVLAAQSSYNVLATVNLSSLNNKFGTASLSQFNISFDTAPVPEPASMAVLGLGLAGIAKRRRARR